jgi:hypothetical protein
MPMGRDTYIMSDTGAWSWSSGAKLKAGLYRDATLFCQEQGKEMMPVSSNQNNANMTGTFAQAEIQFRCLASIDPDLRRPTMEQRPDIVIHNK